MQKQDNQLIQELMARYAATIDAKDYAGIGACFTEDATARYSDFSPPLAGRGPIVTHMRKALDPLPTTQHMFGNFIIDVDGDTAQASCAIIAQHMGSEGRNYLSGGQYALRLRRHGEDWQIADATAREVWSMGDRSLLPQDGVKS
jgi:ketosteroid isomerase-like protein